MKALLIPIFLLVACGPAIKQEPTTPVKVPTTVEKIAAINSTYETKDLPLVEIESAATTAGQNGELQTYVVTKDIVPYDGVLLNPEGMAFIVSEYEAQLERSKKAVEKQRDIDLSKLNYETGSLIIQLEASEHSNSIIVQGRDDEIKRLQQLHQEALDAAKKPWKKILIGVGSALVGAGVGVIIGVTAN